MTTGVEHYREAERLLATAGETVSTAPMGSWSRQNQLDAAQVHATLALAAATAMQHCNPGSGMLQDDRAAWLRAASEYPAAEAGRRQRERDEAAGFQAGEPS